MFNEVEDGRKRCNDGTMSVVFRVVPCRFNAEDKVFHVREEPRPISFTPAATTPVIEEKIKVLFDRTDAGDAEGLPTMSMSGTCLDYLSYKNVAGYVNAVSEIRVED